MTSGTIENFLNLVLFNDLEYHVVFFLKSFVGVKCGDRCPYFPFLVEIGPFF